MSRALVKARAARMTASARRQQILDAAIDSFATANYSDVATAAIAARLGISEPALFRYFPSKRALYLEALDRSADSLINHWREHIAAGPTPLDALASIGRWYFDQMQTDTRHLLLRFRSFSEAAEPAVAACVRAHYLEVFQLLDDLFRQAQAAGQLPSHTSSRAQAWLFVALGGLLDVAQLLGPSCDLRAEDLGELLTIIVPPATTNQDPS